VLSSLECAVESLFAQPDQSRCFIIGGADVYAQALDHEYADLLYLTQIEGDFNCDVFFPQYEDRFVLVSESDLYEENGVSYQFKVFQKRKN